jgi:tetratricopeptide (TPR) repeat protein
MKNYLELLGIKDIQLTARDEDGSVLHEMVETIGKKLQLVAHNSSNSASCHLNSVEKRIVDILTSQGSNSNEEQSDAFLSSLKPKSETATVKRKLPPGAYENDNELDVVCTLLIAVKRVYADVPNEEEGLILCDLAVALLEEADGLKKKKMNQWKSLMVQCRRIRGCLYGLCAIQCKSIPFDHSYIYLFIYQGNEPEKRLDCLNESLVSLSKASELDPHSWQAFYELGLHQAISGDRSQAMTSIKRSVELNPDFIPGWHLLALLQKHSSQALVILQHVSDKHTIDEQDTLEKAMLFMRLKMCQLSVLEELEGPCTEGYTSLFCLFFKLSKKMNLLPTVVSKSQSVSSSTSKSLPSSYSKTSSGFLSENSSNMSLQTIESIGSSHEDDQDENQLENKQGLDKIIEGEQEHQVESESGISKRSRRSLSFSKTRLDDPLLSNIKRKKEKNGARPRRNTILGLRSSFRNNSGLFKGIEQWTHWKTVLISFKSFSERDEPCKSSR